MIGVWRHGGWKPDEELVDGVGSVAGIGADKLQVHDLEIRETQLLPGVHRCRQTLSSNNLHKHYDEA